ncbi:MAG: phosphotransferase [Thermoleophilia bacterium]|nr:phosphotransferase [Thermoleophilia bacterium]
MRPTVDLPRGFDELREEPGGEEWLAALPRLVGEVAEAWSLRLGEPVEPAHIAYVAPVRLSDGGAAVLKLNVPHRESEHEAHALAHWEGLSAVRLFAHDPSRRALLLERCEPGTALSETDEDEALTVAATILRRLARPPSPGAPFRRLEDEAARWARELPARWARLGRPFERALLDEAVAFLAAPAPGEEAVVLHQDLHGGNVLRAEREPWLAIDPKPLVGERAFDTASFLRDRRPELARDPDPVRRLRRRLDRLSADLALDRERVRGWGVVHALAWGVTETEVLPMHVACARWLAALSK